ncbi:DoxX family protein [Intrasporangium oryzae NRRL B-24470]|uniref:DoxX family protein n=1 Tax=Intrasporangium oryzae NRRL B-24470 TaxID=1386089 RepID=W9GHJ0_9MICO|nr:DoxX family protein [Intrasporangium oryzae]EWT03359.1 DoxX family protein [Intrasporangium oryzae NRRL B-24470]
MSQLILDRRGTETRSAVETHSTSEPQTAIETRAGETRATRASKPTLVDLAIGHLQRLLDAYSVMALRISLGLVFLGFGVLKFFPGLSPAEAIASATIDRLTFGLVSGRSAVVLTAVLETFIGLTLVSGKLLRTGLVVLAGAFVGILSPLVLFFDELFPHGPTLLGQYVLKDIVLVAAALVVAAAALGSRLRSDSGA